MSGEIHKVASTPRLTVRYFAREVCEFQPHTHSKMVVTAILSGGIYVTIGETELELSAGQIAFTNAGQNHSGRGRQAELVSIGIDPAMITEAMAEIGQVYQSTQIAF